MREGLVLALVRERAVPRLVIAFLEAKVLQDCEATDRALGASGQSVLIVDPTVVGVSTDWLISLRETVPGTGFVIYAELDPTVFAVLAELVRNGFTDVVLRGYDDAPGQIGRLVVELKFRPLALRVLEELRPQLEQTHPALHAAVSAMFRKPQLYRTTSDNRASSTDERAGGIPPHRLRWRNIRASADRGRENHESVFLAGRGENCARGR